MNVHANRTKNFNKMNIYITHNLGYNFEQLALAMKTEFALKFFKPGGPPSRFVRLC